MVERAVAAYRRRMAKRREIEPGGIYHLGSRGSNRGRIYWDDEDREGWERLLSRVSRRREWDVLAYAEMTNHFHLIVRVPDQSLSAGMQELNGVYSRRTNARRGRSAHLFKNRFWSKPVNTQEYLFGALEYVDLNAYVEDMCEHPSEWRWGSYSAIAGYRHPPPFLAVGEVLGLFHRDPATAVRLYREFVEDAMARADKASGQTEVMEP
jgi:putative transposase